jgi:ketosteroid isomerase-like protein
VDRLDIQDTISRYSQGCSLQDWDMVIDTFLPDGAWEVPSRGLRFEGHATLRAVMSGMVKDMEWFVQMNSPAVITVSGDTATARSIVREAGRTKGSDEILDVLGFYDDELVRTSSGWKFARKVFTGAGLHGIPVKAPMLPG